MQILIVDDDRAYLDLMRLYLEKEPHVITLEQDCERALELLRAQSYDILISDLLMEPISGLELARQALAINPELYVIIVSALDSVKNAVEALKIGAQNYLLKPINKDELLLQIHRAAEDIERKKELQSYRRQQEKENTFLTADAKMQAIVEEALKAADSDSSILISGENGTGKEVLAETIHFHSPRASKPFVTVNCGALTEELLSSELFGHVKGAFTGAEKDHKGYFEISSGGTIFLDEIGEMSPAMQVKLLRVLQDKKFTRVGDTMPRETNVRVIAATNRKLSEEIKKGKFREDLYYRLNVFEFLIPPLRKRKKDILLYFEYFLKEYFRQNGRHYNVMIHPAVKKNLEKYEWPGNTRELKNLAERIAILGKDAKEITLEFLPAYIRNSTLVQGKKQNERIHDYNYAKKKIVRDFEIRFISEYLRLNEGNVEKTAKMIGVHPVSLRQKISRIGIDLWAIKREFK